MEKGAAHGLRIFRNEPARSWRGVLRMDMAGTGLVDLHDAVPYSVSTEYLLPRRLTFSGVPAALAGPARLKIMLSLAGVSS